MEPNITDKITKVVNIKKELKGKILGCFCKPKACHCDIIKEYLDNLK